jgi:RHS repeat-associated protein
MEPGVLCPERLGRGAVIMRALRTVCIAVLIAVALSLYAGMVGAEDTTPEPIIENGFASDKLYQFGDIDSVDLSSGTVSLRIPIGQSYKVGPDLTFGLTLVYNSSVWDFIDRGAGCGDDPCIEAVPHRLSNAGLGWNLSLGRLYDPADIESPMPNQWVFVTSDGGQHRFHDDLHTGDPSDDAMYTRDGTYIRMQEGQTNQVRLVEMPNGIIYTFKDLDGDKKWLLDTISDPHGNNISVTYTTSTRWDIYDSFGRHHTVIFSERMVDRELVKYVSVVWLEGFNGINSVYTFHYDDVIIPRSAKHNFVDVVPMDVSVSLLRMIELPQTTEGANDPPEWRSYVMEYYQQSNPAVRDQPGMVKKLSLPTGGGMEWIYQDWIYQWVHVPDGCMNETCWDIYTNQWSAIQSKKLVDRSGVEIGTWAYDTQLDDIQGQHVDDWIPMERQTIVTSPELNDIVYYFRAMSERPEYAPWPSLITWDYALPYTRRITDPVDGTRSLSVDYYDGSSDATNPVLVRSKYVRYENDGGGDYYRHGNRHLAASLTVYWDDVVDAGTSTYRWASVESSDFDGLGHFRSSVTDGNFEPDAAANVIQTTTNFNPSGGTYPGTSFVMPGDDVPWIIGLYDRQDRTQGGVTARQELWLSATTGRLLRTRSLKYGTTRSANDIIGAVSYDAYGFPTIKQYYGGDLQDVGTGNLTGIDLSGLVDQHRIDNDYDYGTLARSWFVEYDDQGAPLPPAFYSVNRLVDSSTGFVKRSYDTAGLYTDISYDLRGRVTTITPQSGHGAVTEYVYTSRTNTAPAMAEVFRKTNDASANVLTHEKYLYDDLGRLDVEKKLLPDSSWNQRLSTFNGSGWVTSRSEWQPDGTTDVEATVFSGFDPFGRAELITAADGQSTVLSYTGVSKLERTVMIGTALLPDSSVQLEAAKTTEVYDRHGRICKVVEPADDDGSDVTTTYSYDVAGRLSQVVINDDGTLQTRAFSHDNRGFLSNEQMPEKTGPVSYSKYNVSGQVGRVIDGASDLTYDYDRAGRLTKLSDTATGIIYRSYQYATENGTNDWANGKLRSVVNNNEFPESGKAMKQAGDLIFADGFESGDTSGWSLSENVSSGSISKIYTYGGIGGRISSVQTNFQEYTFNHGYTWTELGNIESISYPDLDGFPDETPRTVSYSYTNGVLTGVPGYASSITYHANGMINQVIHANGVVDSHYLDLDWMRRPRNIQSTAGSWGTGVYKYDAAGNIIKMGSSHFLYDKVSRLVEGSPRGDGVNATTQSYVFDAFGNINSVTTDGQFYSTFTYPSTNRFSGATYDDSGNMLAWDDLTFDWYTTGEIHGRTGPSINRTFYYDADGERIISHNHQSGVSTFAIRGLGGKVLRTYDYDSAVWAWTKDYIYRNGLLLAAETPTETKHFTLDHLGSVRVETDGSGIYQKYHAYYGFGGEANTTWDEEVMKFTGHERDLEGTVPDNDDLDYMHARYYSPYLARFLSVDPVYSGNSESSQSWNMYAYAINNPIRYIDPNGETASDIANYLDKRIIDIALNMQINTGNIYVDSATNRIESSVVRSMLGATDLLRIGDSAGMAYGLGQSGEMILEASCNDSDRTGKLILTLLSLGAVASMFGENGTQFTSLTVWERDGDHLDVENPNPGQRPGQIHFQDRKKNKYQYDPDSGKFIGAPNRVNKLLKNEEFKRALQKALRFLGEQGAEDS